MWKSITWLFKTSLTNQIITTIGLWGLIIFYYFALQANAESWVKITLWIVGIVAFIKGAGSYSEFEKKAEGRMSTSDLIARGVSKGQNAGIHGFGQLISISAIALFWMVLYLIFISLSVMIAPVMTVIITLKLIEKKEPTNEII